MSGEESAAYPRELEGHIVLRDGTRVAVRPIRPDDEARLAQLHDRLSQYTAYQRFFAAVRRLPADWARSFSNVDYRGRLALVAEGERGELIAVARYDRTDREDTVEVAFVVQDDWQNRGLGTALLDRLLTAADARGIRRFEAYVLADNQRMLDMLARFTDVRERRTEFGVATIVFAPRAPLVDSPPSTCAFPDTSGAAPRLRHRGNRDRCRD